MALNWDDFLDIKDELDQAYLFQQPWRDYFCVSSDARLQEIQDRCGYVLQKGEALDDLCILIWVKYGTPKNLLSLKEYKGVKIFYEETHEVIPF